MAKRQGGRARGGSRAPAKRGGGRGRLLLGFVAGLVVAALAGTALWWMQGKDGVDRRVVWPWEGRAARPGTSLESGAPLAHGPERAELPARSAPKQAGPAAPRASETNGAAGVPGEPMKAGGAEPPFGESEEVFEAGARVYNAQCASCHGRPGRVAASETGELAAGQFWTAKGGAAVARQSAGAIFHEITEGQPERQMPAYRRVLTDSERWDLALLLKNAGGADLPDPVVRILRAGR